ncbi:MAG: type II toxin-antitoxin system RelE/ParE family toxin [Bacteroidota bacterium]
MVLIFKDPVLEELYKNGKEKGKPVFGQEVVKAYVKKIDILYAVTHSVELTQFKSLHFEALTKEKKYKGMHSIRVNDKYRIILRLIRAKSPGQKDTLEVCEIHELTDYH